HVALGPGLLFGVRQHGFQAHHGRIAAALEAAVGVPDVGHAARHACREVAAGLAQHHHGAAGHVFAAVIPHAFHDRGGARIAHGEAFAGHAVEIGFTGQRTVQHGIAGDDVIGPEAAEVVRRAHDEAAPRKPFAHVIVGFAHQVERDAARQEGAEALAGGAIELDVYRVVRQAVVPVAAGHLARQHGSDAAVAVAH